jgi:hypothetical protein
MPPKKKVKKSPMIVAFTKKLEKQKNIISVARDHLRELKYEIEALEESSDRGIEAIEEAVTILSELA